ncbi:MAG: hypothetical protein ABIP51_20670 [Bacteroidia bacterium]
MQIRDKYKRKLCYAEKIELFILDISNLKSTKEENKFIYYKEIENFILNKIG